MKQTSRQSDRIEKTKRMFLLSSSCVWSCRVFSKFPSLSEHTKLEFVREIGFTHMRILEGMQTYLQLAGCVAKLCKLNMKPALFNVPNK